MTLIALKIWKWSEKVHKNYWKSPGGLHKLLIEVILGKSMRTQNWNLIKQFEDFSV